MSPRYDEPVAGGPLRQGEILENVWELKSRDPASEPEPDAAPNVEPIHPPLSIVISPACDLDQDHKVRFPEDHESAPTPTEFESRHETVPYVSINTLYDEAEIRSARNLSSDLWKRVRQNDNQRYHRLSPGPIGTIGSIDEPLYLDFRKTIAIPTDGLYTAITSGKVRRIAVLLPLYAQDMSQRYHAYLSRVGLPDEG